MRVFLSILVVFSFIIPLYSSLLHESHLLKRLRRTTGAPPQEYIEVSKPLPFTNSTPSCTLPVLSYDFGNTMGLPPVSVNYSTPTNCTWTGVELEIRVFCQGQQYDRIAAVWLDGAEMIRTSTAEPNDDGIFWSVRKDITRYSSLLSQENLTLSVMLENIVNEVYTGVYQVNVTLFYYDTTADDPVLLALPSNKPNLNSPEELIKLGAENLYVNPADLIIPISASGEKGYWFNINKGSEIRSIGVQIPPNTYKAVVEIYVSFHGDDEFWYWNPPDSYIEMNKLNTGRGHGAYREVLLTIDGKLVGSVVPFPVIFTGGVNPLFWEPIVSVGAFNLPSYDFDLTPFLGLLNDGEVHYIGLGVAESISFWLVDANLHLWLDDSVLEVQAGVHYKAPLFSTEREFKFEGLEGSFEVEVKRKNENLGWVNSTLGNFTTYIVQELEFKNKVEFKSEGKMKTVEQKVKQTNEVRILSSTGSEIWRKVVSREYPLKITNEALSGNIAGTYLMTTELENSMREKTNDGNTKGDFTNKQKCTGWMFVEGHDVVSGAANTQQNYNYRDGSQCYSRLVAAYNGKILSDDSSFLCSSPS